MADYRAYIVDEDGHFLRSVDLECPDDETAKQRAAQLVNGHDVELWQQDRKIADLKMKADDSQETKSSGKL